MTREQMIDEAVRRIYHSHDGRFLIVGEGDDGELCGVGCDTLKWVRAEFRCVKAENTAARYHVGAITWPNPITGIP